MGEAETRVEQIDGRDILRPGSRPRPGRARNGHDRLYVIAEFGGGAGIGIVVLRGVDLPVAIPLLGEHRHHSETPLSRRAIDIAVTL